MYIYFVYFNIFKKLVLMLVFSFIFGCCFLYITLKSISLWQSFKFYTNQNLKIDLFFPLIGYLYYLMRSLSKYNESGYFMK